MTETGRLDSPHSADGNASTWDAKSTGAENIASILQPTSSNMSAPSLGEVELVIEFYRSCRAEIMKCHAAVEEIYKLYLTISSALLAASISANHYIPSGFALLCCITPCISIVFAKWRQAQSTAMLAMSSHIREDINSYIKAAFPRLQSERLSLLNWDEFLWSEHLSRPAERDDFYTSMLILHFPSFLSLATAIIILLSSAAPPSIHNCTGWPAFCEFMARGYRKSHQFGSWMIVAASFSIWIIGLTFSLQRYLTLHKSIGWTAKSNGR